MCVLAEKTTVDRVGPELLRQRVIAEQLREETKYLKIGERFPIRTAIAVVEPSLLEAEKLLGTISYKQRYANFPSPPPRTGPNTAFEGYALIGSIGNGKNLQEKITLLQPKQTKDTNEKLNAFTAKYTNLDTTSSEIYGKMRQYHKP